MHYLYKCISNYLLSLNAAYPYYHEIEDDRHNDKMYFIFCQKRNKQIVIINV